MGGRRLALVLVIILASGLATPARGGVVLQIDWACAPSSGHNAPEPGARCPREAALLGGGNGNGCTDSASSDNVGLLRTSQIGDSRNGSVDGDRRDHVASHASTRYAAGTGCRVSLPTASFGSTNLSSGAAEQI